MKYLSAFIFSILISTLYADRLVVDNPENDDNLEKVSLQLQYFHQFQFAGYYVAKERGFYRDVGIDLDIHEFKVGVIPVDEVLLGKANYAIGRSALIAQRSNGNKVVALLSVLQSTPSVMMSKKSSNIDKIDDFIGKKMAIIGTEVSDSIHALLLSKKIDFSDINVEINKNRFELLLKDKVDIITGYTSNQPYYFEKLGIELNIFDPKDYGFDFYSEVLFTSEDELNNHKERVDKFINATLKGWRYAFEHIDETVDLILKKYNAQNKSKEALLFEAKVLKELAFYNTDELGHIQESKMQRIYDMYNLMGLVENKIDFSKFIYHPDKDRKLYYLTDDEKSFLNTYKTFTFTGYPSLFPFESFEQGGVHRGIIDDYTNYLQKELNIDFNKKAPKNHSDMIKMAKSGSMDVISADIHEIELYDKYIPIESYLKNPVVIAMAKNSSFVNGIKEICDKKIAIPRDYAYSKEIIKGYPYIDFITVNNAKEGLLGVESGKYDVYLDSLTLINYTINHFSLDNVEVVGKSDMDVNFTFFVNKEKPLLHAIINKMLKNSSNISLRNEWNHIDHEIIDYTLIWQLVNIFLVILVVVVFFLIKQSRLKNLLAEQKDVFEKLYQKSTDGILLLENNRFKDCNESVVRMLGYNSKDEFLDTHPWELSPEYQPDGRLSSEKSKEMDRLAYERGSNIFEWVHLKANGERVWMEVALTRISLNQRDILHVVWRDIQRKKELEEELLKINRDLEKKVKEEVDKNIQKDKKMLQNAKMAQMGEMISMIAHQWRQPLGSIASTAMNMKMKILMDSYDLSKQEDADECKKFFSDKLDDIDTFVQSLTNTINDFRNFYKTDKQSVHVKIKEPTLKALHIIQNSLKSDNIEVYDNFKSEARLNLFESEVMQVILNIFQNAQDNFKEHEIEKPLITINTYDVDDKVVLEICDNGGGIKESIIDSIFDPYFSTKHKKNGTGLGLYMSKTIIEEHHGGSLQAINREGGVCFRLEFNLFNDKIPQR